MATAAIRGIEFNFVLALSPLARFLRRVRGIPVRPRRSSQIGRVSTTSRMQLGLHLGRNLTRKEWDSFTVSYVVVPSGRSKLRSTEETGTRECLYPACRRGRHFFLVLHPARRPRRCTSFGRSRTLMSRHRQRVLFEFAERV